MTHPAKYARFNMNQNVNQIHPKTIVPPQEMI